MVFPSAHEIRPERERQREAFHEHQHGHDDKNHGEDCHFLGLELVTAERADEDQYREGNYETERLQQVAKEDQRQRNVEDRLERKLRNFLALDYERLEEHDP